MSGGGRFDLDSYEAAVEGKDVASWLRFFAEEAEWREYRAGSPPGSPNAMVGKERRGVGPRP